jgi:hypothetical protein
VWPTNNIVLVFSLLVDNHREEAFLQLLKPFPLQFFVDGDEMQLFGDTYLLAKKDFQVGALCGNSV